MVEAIHGISLRYIRDVAEWIAPSYGHHPDTAKLCVKPLDRGMAPLFVTFLA